MDNFIQIRIWTASVAGLMAALYVHFYNQVGLWQLGERDVLIGLLITYLKCERIAFVLPVVGVVAAIKLRKAEAARLNFFISELLYFFAIAWILIGILLWEAQGVRIKS
jgi:hypothetical protein